jgi:hypothetical protein
MKRSVQGIQASLSSVSSWAYQPTFEPTRAAVLQADVSDIFE